MRAALAAVLLFIAGCAAAQSPVPPLAARVTDLTGTLTASQRAALEAKLESFERRKGSQVAVLIVPTTQPETIEQYGIRLFDAWKLGRARVDDGVLLLVAKDDRRLRVEVGRGLEGAIPDAVAKRIVSDTIAPRFRSGDFYAGIDAGVDRIVRLIDGERLPPAGSRAAPPASGGFTDWIFAGFVLVLVVGGFLRAVFGRLLGSGIVGAGAGAIGYLLAGLAAAVAVGAIAFILTLLAGGGPRSRWSSGRGWGGGYGGGFGSGGGMGGGFRGGGGGGAGGGASGSW
ncbi:MAG: YgcG family protein [Burkholderiales bacterium]|nr:YgcG family protein [Burkholderiales bacterium]